MEAALDAREGQLQDSWQLLQTSATALKQGDVAGAASASAVVGMVSTWAASINAAAADSAAL